MRLATNCIKKELNNLGLCETPLLDRRVKIKTQKKNAVFSFWHQSLFYPIKSTVSDRDLVSLGSASNSKKKEEV